MQSVRFSFHFNYIAPNSIQTANYIETAGQMEQNLNENLLPHCVLRINFVEKWRHGWSPTVEELHFSTHFYSNQKHINAEHFVMRNEIHFQDCHMMTMHDYYAINIASHTNPHSHTPKINVRNVSSSVCQVGSRWSLHFVFDRKFTIKSNQISINRSRCCQFRFESKYIPKWNLHASVWPSAIECLRFIIFETVQIIRNSE